MANDKFILPLHYKDIIQSTQGWTDEEFGAYIRLLIHQWSQGEVPQEIRRIKIIAESGEKNWILLAEKFKTKTVSGLQNDRMEEIREELYKFQKKQSENGKKGGRPPEEKSKETQEINPKETQSEPTGEAKKKPYVSSSSSSSMSDSKEEDKGEGGQAAEVLIWPTFDDFWELYDKKRSRPKCEKKWANLPRKEKEFIMNFIPDYKQNTPDKQYRKDPFTFLNQESWNDELIIKTNGKQQFDGARVFKEATSKNANH